MTYKLKVRSGFHSDGTAVYRKGQVFESTKPLHKSFVNKFDLVGTSDGNGKERPRKRKKLKYNTVKALEEIGKDVTQKFPDALNQGLRVWQNEDGEFHVTKETDVFTPINEKPMTRSQTKQFLLNL